MLRGRQRFDLVLAPYNSGAVIVQIASTVCARHNVPFFEPTLFVPIFTPYRYAADGKWDRPETMPYDNSLIVPGLKAKCGTLPPPKNVLFIDDEIGNGTAFSAVMAMVRTALGVEDDISCTIVAEENGFRTDYSLPGVRAKLVPFARRPSPDVNGILFHLVPEAIVAAFEKVGVFDRKQILCTLMGLPVKVLEGCAPTITYDLYHKARSGVPHFERLQSRFLDDLNCLAHQAWITA